MNTLVEVALSQVGYWNKSSDAYLDSNTAKKKAGYNGYTKYGKWYGMNPAPWCGIFISWCGYQANCLDAVGGKIAYVPKYTSVFQERGRYHARWKDYTPSPGDIVIFGDEAHVGIVERVSSGYLYTIEGNANGGCVARNTYKLSDNYIMGYCETRLSDDEKYPVIEIKQGTYKNGSTVEPVYADSDCVDKIGELNKYESCTKIGTCGNKTIVIYPVDGTKKYKIGFVVYEGG